MKPSDLITEKKADDLELKDISPDLRPTVRAAMVRFPMERDRLSAVIRMLQQDAQRQKKNIGDINRLDREQDAQDLELNNDDSRLDDLEKRMAAVEKGSPKMEADAGDDFGHEMFGGNKGVAVKAYRQLMSVVDGLKELDPKQTIDKEAKKRILQQMRNIHGMLGQMQSESLRENKEGKNMHMTHLEDLVLDQGYDGVVSALKYVDGVREMLAQGGGKQKVTVKWDGAPAIFVGTDPADGKFFVGTKSVFAKDSKMVKGKADLEKYYAGEALYDILGYAFTYLKKLPIKGVLQGDLLFSPKRPPEQVEIDGEDYLSFRPNTITYAVATDSDLAKRISAAKMGIVFHTRYEGASLPEMTAAFGADVSDLQGSSDVWVEDAYYTDMTGSATLTDTENAEMAMLLTDISRSLQKTDRAAFDKFITEQSLSAMLNQYMNSRIKAGKGVDSAKEFLSGFLEFYKGKMEKEMEKLKGGAGSPAYEKRVANIKEVNQFVKDNMGTLLQMINIYSRLIEVKLKVIAKLNTIEGIGTFLKTPDGYQVTNPEGYVAIGHEGGAVKFNDRIEFNQANFTMPKEW